MKYTMTLIACLLMMVTVSAQDNDHDNKSDDQRMQHRQKMEERLESRKIGYITKELDLTSDEAQAFWPIYNEYTTKRKALRSDDMKALMKKRDEMTESDADLVLDQMFEKEEKQLALKRDFSKRLESVISKKKIVKLMHVEHRFKKEVLKSVKKKMRRKRGEKRERKRKEK